MSPRSNQDDLYIKKLRSYLHKHRSIPSFRALGKLLGIRSTGGVAKLMDRLESRGYVVREGKRLFPTDVFFSYTLHDSVRAGFPNPGDEENAHDITIDQYLVENPNTTVLIKVSGESMMEAGILEGDLVVVEQSRKHKVGDMVVAQVDGDYTLKFLRKDARGYFLQAAHPEYPDIRADHELQVFGVVTGMVRKMGG